MTTLVFDIETVPDIELGRQVLGLEGLADGQVAKAMFAHARQHGGSEFLPHEQHRIVGIEQRMVLIKIVAGRGQHGGNGKEEREFGSDRTLHPAQQRAHDAGARA